MKKKINNIYAVVIIITSMSILNSCEKETTKNVTPNNVNKIEYQGLNVHLPDGYNSDIIAYELSDLQKIFYSKSHTLLKSSPSEIFLTFDELDDLAMCVLDKYPNTDSLATEDIYLIKKFFIDIDELTIYENIDIIEDFFETLIRYDYVDTLAKYTPTTLKSSNYFGYDVSKAEFWALVWHPGLINPTKKATEKANELTAKYFPNQSAWQTKADAFRHAIWNALIAKNVGEKKNSVNKCVEWAKKFTDKHEEGGTKPQGWTDAEFEFDNAMDYHNNKIGRDYFKTVAWEDKRKWYQATRIKAPSETDMANAIFNKAEVAKKVTSKAQINSYPSFLVYIKD